MFIVYSNNEEGIICTKGTEAEMLQLWFDDADRDITEYDREEFNGVAINIASRVNIKG